jgi:hypothetical protein
MAGSYNHAVDDEGRLRNWRNMTIATETQGDAYETIEEMYGMVWFLAQGDPDVVEDARRHYQDGIEFSPGREPESVRYSEDQ